MFLSLCMRGASPSAAIMPTPTVQSAATDLECVRELQPSQNEGIIFLLKFRALMSLHL